MASSGNFSTNKYNSKICLKLSWTSTQDIVNNRTTIKWTLQSSGGSTGNWWMAGPVTATINGTKVVNTTSRFKLYGGGKYKKTGSINVAHNADGTKSVSMSIKAAIYSSSVNCTASKTYTLNKIDRYAYITGGTTTFGNADYPTITYTNPLGSAAVTGLRLRILWNNDTESTDWVTVGDESGSYTFTSETLTDANKDAIMATSVSAEDIPLKYDLASTMNGVEYHSYFNGYMVIGTVTPTVTGMRYVSIDEDYADILGNYTDLIARPVKVIDPDHIRGSGHSKFKVVFDTITASAGAKVKSVKVSYGVDSGSVTSGDVRYNWWRRQTWSEGEQQHEISNFELGPDGPLDQITNGFFENNELPKVDYPAFAVEIIDSRDKVFRAYIPISIYNYSLPSLTKISVERLSQFYTTTYININASYTELRNALDQPRNHLLIRCYYKKTSDASYVNYVDVTSGVQSSLQLDNAYAWDVLVRVQDDIMPLDNNWIFPEWLDYYTYVPAGTPILFIDKAKTSVSVNCLPVLNNSLEVNGADVSNRYSLQERCVGFWIDGSPIYEKTIFLDSAVTISSGGNYSVPTSIWSQKGLAIDIVLYCHNQNNDHYVWRWVTAGIGLNTGALKLYNGRAGTLLFDGFTIRYTKEPITP